MDDPLQPDLLQPTPAPVASDNVAALQEQVQDFKLLFNATFVGLIALCLAVNLVFGKQMRMVQRQIERFQPTFAKDDTEFRRTVEPQIHAFMRQLHAYAASHPEYQTNVLGRYRVPLAAYFSTGTIVGQPAPIPQGPGAQRPPGR